MTDFRYLARIDGAQGHAVGAGCLVAEDLVATCAHVVADALGDRSLCHGEAPEGPVAVSLPFAAGDERFEARITAWYPAAPPPEFWSRDGFSDLAFLRIDKSAAAQDAWVELSERLDFAGQGFITFGYPAEMPNGDYAEGRAVGLMPNRWYRLAPELATGRRISPGFSGGPVFLPEVGRVAGLIVLHDNDAQLAGGQMITGHIVHAALDKLRQHEGAPSRGQPRRPDRVPGAPNLPVGFLPRRRLVGRLRGAMGELRSGMLVLIGPLGIGKSVIAAALVEDTAVREEFRDGIHWIAAAGKPSPVAVQALLYRQLAETRPFSLGLAAKRHELARLLKGRRMLIVVDGVEVAAQLDGLPTDVPGPVFLVTARGDPRPEGARSAPPIDVGALDREEAQLLLCKAAAPYWPEAGIENAKVARVISALGGVPLLLVLAGSQVSESGGDWRSVAAIFEGPEGSAQPAAEGEPELFNAFMEGVIGALSPEDQERYRMLSVLSDGSEATWEILPILWDTDDMDAVEVTANTLTRRALAHWTPRGSMAQHELPRAYMQAQISDMTALHREFVDRYRRRCGGHWGALPQDGYAHARLAEHMTRAGLYSDLAALFSDFEWLRRRIEFGAPAELAEELEGHGPTRAARRLGRVVRQATRQLLRNPGALAQQALARLGTEPILGPLRAAARSAIDPPALVPLAPSLASPLTMRATMRGHTDTVASVAISPDGKLGFSASLDRRMRLWDLGSGECVLQIDAADGLARAVAISDDRTILVSGGYDGAVRLWDAREGECLSILGSHTGAVKSVAVARDKHIAASGGSDGLRLWDLKRRRPAAELGGQRDVRSVDLSWDGALAIACDGAGKVRLWRLDGTAGVEIPCGVDDAVRAVALSSEGRMALLGTAAGDVFGRDVGTGGEVFRLRLHSAPVTSVALAAREGIGASCSRDGYSKLFDLSGNILGVTRPHEGRVLSVALSDRGRRLLTGASDGRVRCWDVEAEPESRLRAMHGRMATDLAHSPDDVCAASASDDHSLALWDLRSGTLTAKLEGHKDRLTSVAFIDRRRVASGSFDGTLRIWDAARGTSLDSHDAGDPITAIAAGADATRLLAGYADGTVALWDIDAGSIVQRVQSYPPAEVRALAQSSGGAVAVLGDGRLELWDLAGQTCRASRRIGVGYPTAIWPNGNFAMTTDHAGRVVVWDLSCDAPPQHTRGPDAHASCIAVLDDAWAAFGCHDGSVHLWDLAEARTVALFEAECPIVSVAGTKRMISAGDEAGGVHFLEVRTEQAASRHAFDENRGP